ncbi:hypothetical protein BDF21DRAFT_390190 [Thamnidium elegans]|nr:hypothetical protein BDF21DRAFT_390190 [Thamnidium elegans]
MEAHGAVTVEQNNKKRKVAEDSQTSLTEAQSKVSPTTHSGLSLSPEHYGPSLYDSWEETESEEEIVVEEDIEMNVWDIWKKILDTMQRDGDIDKYSLEHLNIVQLGNKLGSKITREYYPKNLIKKTGLTLEEIPSSFVEDNEFYNNIFDTIALSDEFSSNEVLVEAASLVFKSNNPFMKFFHTVLQSFVSGLFIDDCDVYNNEISYNYYILWPILNSLSKSIQKTKFSLGEKRLEAVSQELKLIHNDNRHFYNADGIISNIESEIEIAILETTGPLLQQNDPKETQDYIKAGYGLVAMLHVIGRKFHYGDFEIFKKIGSFFVQATPTKIRIWRAFMPASKVYVISCIGSVEVPTESKTSEEKLRKLIDLFWFLRQLINESYQAIDELQGSHIDNMKKKARKLEGHEKVTSLCDNFKINTLIKLPQIYIKKSSHLQINSSPIRPDNSS